MIIAYNIRQRNRMLSQVHSQARRPLTQRILMQMRRLKKTQYCGSNSPLYTSICPIVYAARMFGLAPYEFKDNKLVPSDTYVTFTFFWFIVYTYFIWGYLEGFTSSEQNKKATLTYTESAKTVSNYIVAITDLIVCMVTRKQIAWIWNKIQDYDQAMRDLGYARTEKKARMLTWIIIGFNIVLWALINNLGMTAFNESFLYNASYLIVYVGAATAVTKFSGLVLILGQRFKQLNEIAKSNIYKTRWIHADPMIDDKLVDCFHSELTTIGKKLNYAYRWSLILWLGNLSFHSVCCSYFVMDWVLQGNIYPDLINCLLAWFASTVTQLFLIDYSCHYTSSEVSNLDLEEKNYANCSTSHHFQV